jgi:hypothetical protein
MQVLIDALEELVENDNMDPGTLLAQLKSEEDQLYESFVKADLPEAAYQLLRLKDKVQQDLLFKGPSICHTARTPAITRHLGYLTNTDKVGSFAPVGQETYDTGIEKKEADRRAANGVMRLVYTSAKERESNCSVVVKPDYKDYFYAHQKDGTVKVTFPNEAEKQAYRFDQSEYKGLIGIFLGGCTHGCESGDLKSQHFSKGMWEMTVNGKPVTSIVKFGFGCLILQGDDGQYWKPSANGDYEISVLVKKLGSFVRLSSVVLY